jgi:hypothetical protein
MVASLLLWSLMPVPSNVVRGEHTQFEATAIRAFEVSAAWGGFVAFVAGWFMIGAALRPRGSGVLGVVAAASVYVALGLVLATVLTWPGQAATFLLDPFL